MEEVILMEQLEAQSRLEDYLQVIYRLINDKGYARPVEISEKLHVKPSTVSGMLPRLASNGYLVYEPYRGMSLTDKGVRIARSVSRRHSIISELLIMLGVEDEVAFRDTQGIVHHVQPETISKIEGLVAVLRKDPKLLRSIRDYKED